MTKFAIHIKSLPYIKQEDKASIGEIIIPYENQFKALADIERLGGQYKLVFDIFTIEKDTKRALIQEWKELLKVNGNMLLRLGVYDYDFIRECPNVILGLTAGNYAANTYSEAMALYNAGVHEIYVTGSLAADLYQLYKLRKIMRLRMIPNFVQSDAPYFGNPYRVNPLNCFWIGPEGWNVYEDVVDVMEFKTDDKHHEEGLLHIYSSGKWTGNLGDVIIDYSGRLNSIECEDATTMFAFTRANCRLTCMQGSGCTTCEQFEISSKIRQANLENL